MDEVCVGPTLPDSCGAADGLLFNHLMNERTALARRNAAAAIRSFNTRKRKCEDDDNAGRGPDAVFVPPKD